MTTALITYLNFRSQSREAMEFYRSVLGGQLDIATFDDFGMPVPEGDGHLTMHARLRTDDGFVLMASDVPREMPYTPATGFSITLTGDDEPKLEGWFHALAKGGTIDVPLDTPPWGGRFGTLIDRFGIAWMIVIAESE